MKMRMKIFNAAVLAAIAASAMPALAATDTSTVAVSAVVQSICKFTAASGATMAIQHTASGIDPSLSTNATGSTSLTYRCSTGITPTVSFTSLNTSGTDLRVKSGTNYMVYTAAVSGVIPAGTGFAATAQTLPLTSAIASTQFQAAPAATNYADTLTVSLNF